MGEAGDGEDKETVYGLGNRKNTFFHALMNKKGVVVYKSTIETIRELKRMGLQIGVASSSKNCKPIMANADIESLFSVVVDGIVSESLGLQGKPAPDIFTNCVEMLGFLPQESIMVEDATSGVKAGKAGGFGLVVGIDRSSGKNRQPLIEAGADVVVDDFDKITPWHLNDFFLPNDPGYVLQFDGYHPKQERLREALCTLGNGYFATRGCLDECRADADEHYPGTYMARGWNREISVVEGRDVENEDLVNLPDWTYITFRCEGSEWLSWNRDSNGDLPFELLHYDTRLDMRNGLLVRRYRVKDKEGRITMIMSHRVVHMKKPHLGILKYTLIPENWSGRIDICSEVDGSVRNRGVPRYIGLQDKHLRVLEKGTFPLSINADPKDQGVYLMARFTKASIEVAMAARTRVFRGVSTVPTESPVTVEGEEKMTQIFSIDVGQGSVIQVEKLMSLYCSKDRGVGNVAEAAIEDIQRHYMKRHYNTFSLHQKLWTEVWRRMNIEIELAPEEASPTLKSKNLREVKKKQRELRTLSGSQEDPSAEAFFRSLTGATMGNERWKYYRTLSRTPKLQHYTKDRVLCGGGKKAEKREQRPLVKYSDIAGISDEIGLLRIASRHLQKCFLFLIPAGNPFQRLPFGANCFVQHNRPRHLHSC